MSGLALLATGPLGLLLRATLVLVAALLLDRGLRPVAALSRHMLWVATAFALLALPVLQLELPRLRIPGWRAANSSAEQKAPMSHPVVMITGAATESAALITQGPSSIESSPVELPREDFRTTMPLRVGFTLGWLAGGLVLLVGILRSVRRARRVVGEAIPVENQRFLVRLDHARRVTGVRRPVALRVSEEIRTPMTGGVGRAVILLPLDAADWSDNTLDTVLYHELVHVRRFDALHQLMSRFAVACYWFHPLAWQGARRAAAAREEACDEAVISLGARPSNYARHLVDLAEHGANLHSMPALARLHHPNLEDRIMAILRTSRAPASPRHTLTAVAALLLWTAVVAAASPAEAQRPERAPNPPVPPPVVVTLPTAAPAAPLPPEPTGAVTIPSLVAPAAPDEPSITVPSAPSPPDCDGARAQAKGTTTRMQVRELRSGGIVCIALRGALQSDFRLSPLDRLPNGVTLILAATVGDETQRLEIQGTASGNQQRWSVNGEARPFDADATEWRDAMLAFLSPGWQRTTEHATLARTNAQRELELATSSHEVAITLGRADSIHAMATRQASEAAELQHELSTVQTARANQARARVAHETMAVAEVARSAAAAESQLAEVRARSIVADSVVLITDSVVMHLAPTMARVDSMMIQSRLQRRELELSARQHAEAMAVDRARLERLVDTMRVRATLENQRFAELRERAIQAGAVRETTPEIVVERRAFDPAAELRLRKAIEQIGPR